MFYDKFVQLCAGVNKKPSVVAEEMGMHKSMVSNWKHKKNGPSDVTMQKVANYFGVSVEWLKSDEPDEADTEKAPDPAPIPTEGLSDIKRKLIEAIQSRDMDEATASAWLALIEQAKK